MSIKTKETISELLATSSYDREVSVNAWVKTIRKQKKFSFVALNDGSTVKNLQAIIDKSIENYEEIVEKVNTGASLRVTGKLVKSPGKGQNVELQASEIHIYGLADPEEYPLQSKKTSLDFLRQNAHLRTRSYTFTAVFRISHAISYAIHNYFNREGFNYIRTPIITASDCEGAGEMFQVTTLQPNDAPKNEIGSVDYEQDFFGKQSFLTVSGQLNAELLAHGLGKVYTFGPTFRAENSNTTRHLAEFWMIEPEAAFYDIEDNMDLAENFLQYVINYVLENNREDLELLAKNFDETLIERLEFVVNNPFERVTYTQVIDILKSTDKKFEYPVDWGTDLQSEHERFLVEEHFNKPVIVTDYPKAIKAFYMKANEDGKTVAAMDVLFPGIGEIIGGSQREENLEKLEGRIAELGLPLSDYWWYLDMRRFGSVPHSGFGLGLERLISFVTGMNNIRDVIPFPRAPKTVEF